MIVAVWKVKVYRPDSNTYPDSNKYPLLQQNKYTPLPAIERGKCGKSEDALKDKTSEATKKLTVTSKSSLMHQASAEE